MKILKYLPENRHYTLLQREKQKYMRILQMFIDIHDMTCIEGVILLEVTPSAITQQIPQSMNTLLMDV